MNFGYCCCTTMHDMHTSTGYKYRHCRSFRPWPECARMPRYRKIHAPAVMYYCCRDALLRAS